MCLQMVFLQKYKVNTSEFQKLKMEFQKLKMEFQKLKLRDTFKKLGNI